MKPPPPLEIQRQAAEKPVSIPDDTRIVSGFECSATLDVLRVTDTHFRVQFKGKRGSLDNYFLFRVEGAAGRTVRIDFENAPLGKWWSLNPVYSYVTDLAEPANSINEPLADPLPPTLAYNGPLLPDTRGEKWHFMPNVWSEKDTKSTGRLCMVHTFEADSAYVGLKVPYTPSLNERFMASLEGHPHAQVLTIGYPYTLGRSRIHFRGQVALLKLSRRHHSATWLPKLGTVGWLASSDEEGLSRQFARLLGDDTADSALRYFVLNRCAFNGRARLGPTWRHRTFFSNPKGMTIANGNRLKQAAQHRNCFANSAMCSVDWLLGWVFDTARTTPAPRSEERSAILCRQT